MLSSVFKHRGLDLSNNEDIKDIIKFLDSSKSRQLQNHVPWNLDVVLSWLSGSKFEPLRTCSLRDLTRKTPFLVALATAKRVSEIQAIDKEIGFNHGDAVCSLSTQLERLSLAGGNNDSQSFKDLDE